MAENPSFLFEDITSASKSVRLKERRVRSSYIPVRQYQMKYTDGYWNENGDFIEFNEEIKVPSYISSNGHITAVNPNDR